MAAPRRRSSTRKRNIVKIVKFFSIGIIILAIIVGVSFLILSFKKGKQSIEISKEEKKQSEKLNNIYNTTLNVDREEITKRDVLINIIITGEVFCDKDIYASSKKEDGSIDFNPILSEIMSTTKDADLVILETSTLFKKGDFSYGEKNNAPRELVDSLKILGADVININASHALDYSIEGIKETKEYLEEKNISVIGTNLIGENEYFLKKTRGATIGILTYTYDVINNNSLEKDISEIKEKGADFCIVLLEGEKTSEKEEEITNFLLEQNVDMILEMASKVPERLEIRKNKNGKDVFIAHSLGSFMSSKDKAQVLLDINLKRNGENGAVTLEKVDYLPTYLIEKNNEGKKQYELVLLTKLISEYKEGNHPEISEKEYEKLENELKKLEEVLNT